MILTRLMVIVSFVLAIQVNAQTACTKWQLYATESVRDNIKDLSIPVKDSFWDRSTGDTITLFSKIKIFKSDLLKFTIDSNHNGVFDNYTLRRWGKFNVEYPKPELELFFINIEFPPGSGLSSAIIFFNSYLGIVMKSYSIEYGQLYYFVTERSYSRSKTKKNDHMDYLRLQKAILKVFQPL